MDEMEVERRVLTPEEHFGVSAGEVYWDLNEEEPRSVTQIIRGTKLKRDVVIGALGWLAREGKIVITDEKPMKFKRL